MKLSTIIKKTAYLVAMPIVMSLASCVSEEFDNKGTLDDGIDKAEGPRLYSKIRLSIAEGATTRAEIFESPIKFDKGDEAEYAIYIPEEADDSDSTEPVEDDETSEPAEGEETDLSDVHHVAFVIDDKGNVVGDMIPLNLTRYTDGDTDYYDSYISVTTSEDYLENFKDLVYPDWKVYTFINASSKLIAAVKDLKTLSALTSLTSSTTLPLNDCLYFTKDDDYYFTMTSSMIISSDSKVVPAIDNTLTFYRSEDEARNSSTKLTIYVERLYSKFTVKFKWDDDKYYYLLPVSSQSEENGGNVPSTVAEDEDGSAQKPIGVERLKFTSTSGSRPLPKLQVVTSYTRSSSIENRNPVTVEEKDWEINIVGWGINGLENEEYLFKHLNPSGDYVGMNPNWFYSSLYPYRTMWSEDPNYSAGNYPDQYRRADDATGVKHYASMTPTLSYSSYKELALKNTRQYTPENTFNMNVLGDNPYASGSYLRIGSHLIIDAQMLIKDFDSQYLFDTNEFFDEEGLRVTYNNTSSAEDKFLMDEKYWSEKAYKGYVAEYLGYFMLTAENKNIFGANNDGNFYVYLPDNGVYRLADEYDFTFESINIKGGDAHVRLKLADGTQLFAHDAVNDEYSPIREDNFNNLVKQHPEFYAARFNKGRMYYAVGSQHSSITPTAPLKIGDYGSVRNNWYSYSVERFTAPGMAVDDPNQKIIPNNLPQYRTISFSLEVLPWHYIYTSVDVSDQPRPTE